MQDIYFIFYQYKTTFSYRSVEYFIIYPPNSTLENKAMVRIFFYDMRYFVSMRDHILEWN